MKDGFVVEFSRGTVLVGFDRADVGGLGTHEVIDQSSGGSLGAYLIRQHAKFLRRTRNIL